MSQRYPRARQGKLTFVEVLIVLSIAAILFSCVIGGHFTLLLTGWAQYIAKALPLVRPDTDRVIGAIAWSALFILGVHWFCRWLYAAWGTSAAGPRRIWRFKWTILSTAIVLMTFAAGTAAVSVVHTIGFMRSPHEKIYGYRSYGSGVEDWRQIAQEIMFRARTQGVGAKTVFRELPYRTTIGGWDLVEDEAAQYAAVDGPDGVVAAVVICHRDPAKRARHGIAVATADTTRLERDKSPGQVVRELTDWARKLPAPRPVDPEK